MFDFPFSQDDLTETGIAIGFAVGGIVLAWFVALFSRRVVHAFTKSTETEVDDLIVDAVRGPLIAFIAIQGVYIGLLTLSYLDDHGGTIRLVWVAIMLVLVVTAVRRLVLEMLDWFARRPGTDGMPGFDSRSLPFLRRILNVLLVSVGGGGGGCWSSMRWGFRSARCWPASGLAGWR